MAIDITTRTNAEGIFGNRVWFIPDGTTYGTASATSSISSIPTFEEATATGLCLGEIETFRWVPEYKELVKKGFSHEINGYTQKKRKIRLGVAAEFSTQDITAEAYALEYGVSKIPAQGESGCIFSNPSGTLRGWLYIERRAGLDTLPEDPALAEIHVRGELGLKESPEHNDELSRVSYEFQVTKTPSDSFKNIGLPVMP